MNSVLATRIGEVVLGLAVVIVLGLLLSLPVMLLWNGCIVGTIVGIGEISWLQAWGILILSNMLFKGVK